MEETIFGDGIWYQIEKNFVTYYPTESAIISAIKELFGDFDIDYA